MTEEKVVRTKDQPIQINFSEDNLAKYMLNILQKEGFTKCKLENKDQYSLKIDSSEEEKFLTDIMKIEEKNVKIDDLQIEEDNTNVVYKNLETKEETKKTQEIEKTEEKTEEKTQGYKIKSAVPKLISSFVLVTSMFFSFFTFFSTVFFSSMYGLKNGLIENSDFFKKVFETLANTPWLVPVVSIISNVASSSALGAIGCLQVAKDNVKDFNYEAGKFKEYEKYDELTNKSWIYKATNTIEIDEGQSK
jgi:Fe2+ transport system protein B